MHQTIPYNQAVFIGYCDASKTVECARIYTADAASYFLAMDEMMQKYGTRWDEFDRRTVDLPPYERFQMEKYGSVLPVDNAFAGQAEVAENRFLSVDNAGRLAEEYFASQIHDYMGY